MIKYFPFPPALRSPSLLPFCRLLLCRVVDGFSLRDIEWQGHPLEHQKECGISRLRLQTCLATVTLGIRPLLFLFLSTLAYIYLTDPSPYQDRMVYSERRQGGTRRLRQVQLLVQGLRRHFSPKSLPNIRKILRYYPLYLFLK
jgi:hypothetical protein